MSCPRRLRPVNAILGHEDRRKNPGTLKQIVRNSFALGMPRRALEEVPWDECFRLLGQETVGRLVYVDDLGPAAVPVNYPSGVMTSSSVLRTDPRYANCGNTMWPSRSITSTKPVARDGASSFV